MAVRVNEILSSHIGNTITNVKTWGNIVINVKDFGAKGDGISDDTSAIQNSLNVAKKTGGARIYVPDGVYILKTVLTIYKNTYFECGPNVKFIRAHNGNMMVNGEPDDMFYGYNGNGNIIIEGGVWDGNILEYSDAGFNCFGFSHAQNVIFRNIEVRDVINAHAIDLSGVKDVLIENCRFLGHWNKSGLRDDSEAIQLDMATASGFHDFGAHDSTPTCNVTVRHCYFGDSGTPGMSPWPVGVGTHYSVFNQFVEKVHIYGNKFDGMTFAGVRSFKFVDVFIHDNEFVNCYRGIACSNSAWNSNSAIDKDGVDHGLPQAGKNYQIHHNIFREIEAEGVYCYGQSKDASTIAWVDSVKITDNIFENKDTTQNGASVSLILVRGFDVSRNKFKNVYRACYLEFAKSGTFSHNGISETIAEGVFSNETNATLQNLGNTSDLAFIGNVLELTGRTGIFIQYCQRFICALNQFNSVSTETHNSRNAITITSGASNGIVSMNRVTKAASGNQNQYGISVSSSCQNIMCTDNDVDGASGRLNLQSSTSWDGLFIQAPNGTRYRMTVDNSGSAVFTAG